MKGLLLSLVLLFTSTLFSMELSAPADSIKVQDSVKVHSRKKAVLFSAIVPGAGQIYNHIAMPKGKKKAFWKVPLIYAGLGTTGYFLIQNQKQTTDFKSDYTKRLNDPNYVSPYEGIYDNAGILTLYNQYLNWRDLSILAFGAIYLLQVVDAGVEAHFVSFDVSEDLSLNLDPVLMNFNNPGVRLTLNFW
ncbi:MAG: hypothetical protein KC454_05165 [Flavobacteriales bacterium]|nr:hypothetical protein [Flavobacteriales bacterium]